MYQVYTVCFRIDSEEQHRDCFKMSFLLPKLSSKKEVDQAIKSTAEKVLVLRFGRDDDPGCLQLDDTVSVPRKRCLLKGVYFHLHLCKMHGKQQAGWGSRCSLPQQLATGLR